jgi:hypothetical protein
MSPALEGQTLDVIEVCITRDKRETMLHGALGRRIPRNESRSDRFAKGCDVPPCDQQTSRVFGSKCPISRVIPVTFWSPL